MNNSIATSELVAPYGGELVNLVAGIDEKNDLRTRAGSLPSLVLSDRAVCDLELLASGAFSPLDRFMSKGDLDRVLGEMRLSNGFVFPVPITLPVDPAPHIKLDENVALRDSRNDLLAIMTIEEIYSWNVKEFAEQTLRTTDLRHPLVSEINSWGKLNISGQLKVVQFPRRFDSLDLRLTPTQVRARLETMGHENVVAFQTRNPLHRAHEEMTKRAIQDRDGILLLHPVVGLTKPGDIDHYSRVRTYRALADRYYEPDRILLSLLPLAMRMAGPREALWHAVIRRNYGANHLIVGRDHASPGKDSSGKPFYGPYDAQDLVESYSEEIGVGVIPFSEMVYLPDQDRYESFDRIEAHERTISISGTEVRDEYLNKGRRLPEWFTRPEVAQILSETFPSRHRQGVCIWFTGLSGAGKSTTAEILSVLLLEHGRQVTLLDGDVVRTNLSKGLGFSREDRNTNIRRLGFVAAEIVRHGGVAICAAISPYSSTRNEVRAMVGNDGFVEVFVDTPIEVCEVRDTKGLYAKARRGEITGFTGVDDPYEPADHAEIILDTVSKGADENALLVLRYLVKQGFVLEGVPESK